MFMHHSAITQPTGLRAASDIWGRKFENNNFILLGVISARRKLKTNVPADQRALRPQALRQCRRGQLEHQPCGNTPS
jgi:hypothetical protein